MDRKLTTILAADLAGYSRLIAHDEEAVIKRLQVARSDIINPALAAFGGRIVKTMGDGLLVEFPSPVQALRSALRVLNSMRDHEAHLPKESQLRFRVGINFGDVILDGDDVLGDAVNIAARLESLAPVGGICISRAVHDLVKDRVDVRLISLGPQSVKNVPNPVEVWRVEVEGADAARALGRQAKRPSIAVLPFDNMSSDPDQEFLADGIVEDVITELSRFRSLTVIARNSTFAYKGQAQDVRRIGDELGVRYIVEGSVRRAGNRLRVTAQLIEAATGAHVWADRWDRTLDDLFALQDALTQAIVTAVEPELGAHERRLARARPTGSLTSWELCQRGWAKLADYTPTSIAEAEKLLKKSAAADADFALPRALLARLMNIKIAAGLENTQERLEEGLTWAHEALDIDDRLEIAYGALAVLLAMSGRSEEALDAASHATALNPNNAFCHHATALSEMFSPTPDGAKMVESGKMALALSPKDPSAHAFQNMVSMGFLMDRLDHSDPEFLASARAATRFPGAPWYVYVLAATAEAAVGEDDAARRYIDQSVQALPGLSFEVYKAAFPFPSKDLLFDIGDRNGVNARVIALGLPER